MFVPNEIESGHRDPPRSVDAPFLSVQGLSKAFHHDREPIEVLRDINISVSSRQIIAILGPSGCGKSTLFNIMAGLLLPDEGNILLEGQVINHLRGRMAYMQQKDLLLPWRTVLDNVVLGLDIQRVPKREARRMALELMPEFGLEGFQNSLPQELSGGMRQRAALMRTMLCRKEILLLDEPFGALDSTTRRVMQQWLLRAWQRFRHTILLVTHDVDEALKLASRIYVLTKRPARIKGIIDVAENGSTGRTAQKDQLLQLMDEEVFPV